MSVSFSPAATEVVHLARRIAVDSGHPFVGPDALLLGLTRQAESAELLSGLSIAPDELRREVEAVVQDGGAAPDEERELTPEVERVLEDGAPAAAERLGHDTVRPGHLVLAILESPGVASFFLGRVREDLDAVREDALRALDGA